jgi:hypothetical protein
MLRHVALVRTEISEERSPSIVKVTRIGELRTTLAVTSNRRTLRRNTKLLVTSNVVPSSPILVTRMMEALGSIETSVLTRGTLLTIPEDGILLTLKYVRRYECECTDLADLADVADTNTRLFPCCL